MRARWTCYNHTCRTPLLSLLIVVMVWLQALSLVVLLSASGCLPGRQDNAGPPIPQLELVAAYSVESPRFLEPSGLTLHDGELYTVADKVDNIIYRIVIDGDVARLTRHILFDPPGRSEMDWEGVTADRSGSFYLTSEENGRMLQVTPDGTAIWATPDLRDTSKKLGLFAKNNAGFEGLAWIGPNHWLGAVEREPRGLVEWQGFGQSVEATAYIHQDSPYKQALPLLRLPDFSGLHADNGTVYAIFRNAHLIVRLEKSAGRWTETNAWSYEHIETDPRWAYRAQTYGQAEGLVVSGRDVYLIFDNNLGGRTLDRNDRRPLLIHARIPATVEN